MKFAIVLIVILSNTELKLSRTQLFPQALKNYFFPKDPGIIRVRTMDEIKTGKGVRILDFVSKELRAFFYRIFHFFNSH